MTIFSRLILVGLLALAGGCVSRPPSIAHVHLGHALTAVHVTPNREGYLSVASERAEQARQLAQQADGAASLTEVKERIAGVLEAVSSEENFGLKQSLVMASNHISFAATSDDASDNIRQAAPVFARDIARVVERCELITLLGNDAAKASGDAEAALLVDEIVKLTQANLEGEDADNDGIAGTTPAEFGVKQLRAEFDAAIAREQPPYRTIDQWYLFNLVRLPNGRWVFDKLNRGGTIEGYK